MTPEKPTKDMDEPSTFEKVVDKMEVKMKMETPKSRAIRGVVWSLVLCFVGIFLFSPQATAGLYDDASGNIGIGTTVPANKLHIQGTGAGAAGIYLNDAAPGTTTATLYNSGGSLYWAGSNLSSGSSLWTLSGSDIYRSNGNVGIGTNSPAALLDVIKSSTSATAATEYADKSTFSDTGVVTTGTDTTYGQYISTTRTGATGGTINTYGLYSTLAADTAGAGTSTAYGIYSSVSGADTNYPAYFTGGPVMVTDGTHTVNTATASGDLFVDGNLEVDGTMSEGGTALSSKYILAPSSPATGSILYWTGSAWAALAPGATSGTVLKSQGTGNPPTWGGVDYPGGITFSDADTNATALMSKSDSEAAVFLQSLDTTFDAQIVNSANLTAAKAASIMNDTNLTAAKAASILSHANLTANKAQSIMYAMTNYSKQIDIITSGASDATISGATTYTGTTRVNNLTINSGITLTLNGQPNVIIANTLTNNGTMDKTKTGGAGGYAVGSGDGGIGGGGAIIIVKTFDNNSLISGNGANGGAGGSVAFAGAGQAGGGSSIHRISTDAIGLGGNGGYYTSLGLGKYNGGGGGAAYTIGGGEGGGDVTYTAYSTAGDLYTKLRKATIDWWLQNVASKTPTTVESFPSSYGSGGGGGGAYDAYGDGGGGGGGGGQIIVLADSLDNTGGTIGANAGNGGNKGTEGGYDNGGGGGGGGMVYGLYRTTLVAAGTLTVAGGAAGTYDNSAPTAGAAGTATTYSVSGADIAENYPVWDLTISAGDLVRIKDLSLVSSADIARGEIILDESITELYLVEKTTFSYDPQMIGVISTNPAKVLGDTGRDNLRAVSLIGRVLVNITTENGEIKAGDYLTSSDLPGVAMKATKPGRVIGLALEPYTKEEIGQVMTFINPHFKGEILDKERLIEEIKTEILEELEKNRKGKKRL